MKSKPKSKFIPWHSREMPQSVRKGKPIERTAPTITEEEPRYPQFKL